jgi:hypothetical protein
LYTCNDVGHCQIEPFRNDREFEIQIGDVDRRTSSFEDEPHMDHEDIHAARRARDEAEPEML